MNEKKLIIFDCDGVLVDSEPVQSKAFAIVLKELNVLIDPEDASEKFRGKSLSSVVEVIQSDFGVTLPNDFAETYRSVMRNLFRQDLQAVRGISSVLEELNRPCCVASNGPQDKMQLTLQLTDLDRFFSKDRIFSGYDIDDFKPSPGLYLYAAKKMNYAAENCVVLEDSITGLQAAIAAGMRVVFYSAKSDFAKAREAGARECISHMSDFLTIL